MRPGSGLTGEERALDGNNTVYGELNLKGRRGFPLKSGEELHQKGRQTDRETETDRDRERQREKQRDRETQRGCSNGPGA